LFKSELHFSNKNEIKPWGPHLLSEFSGRPLKLSVLTYYLNVNRGLVFRSVKTEIHTRDYKPNSL
jgi:hypothetical protein